MNEHDTMTQNNTDTVEIDRETLETLTQFADTHGDEYGSADVYYAIESAYRAMGEEDTEPYIMWRSSWESE